MKSFSSYLMSGYYRGVEPSLVLLRRYSRGCAWKKPFHHITLDLDCSRPDAREVEHVFRRTLCVARRYDIRFQGGEHENTALRPVAMMLDLEKCGDPEGLHRLLKERSSSNLYKIRKAQRSGLVAKRFALPNYVFDVHAVKTSMMLRSCGPVLAFWFLKPSDISPPAEVARPVPVPRYPTHWTMWWGAFLPEPGHLNGRLESDERLVGYIKIQRCGNVVHYLDIMGHRSFLKSNIMLLLHYHVACWLLRGDEPASSKVRAIWYGGLEQGGTGLLTWKRRAGFEPVTVTVESTLN
ncbi:MAG: hypothetical protein QHC90_23250 [Shinella sp.]|nr:hypothetical protein [Shinella sp.]